MWFMLFTLFVILHMWCFSWIIYWWSPIKIFVIRSSKQGNSSGLSLTTNISLWICLLVLAFSTRKRNWEMMKLWQYCLDKSERVKTIFQHSPPTPLSLCFFPRFLFSLATYITLIATTHSAHSVSEHKSLPTHLSFPFHLLCELACWRELGFPASSAQVTFPWLPYRMPTYIPKISVCWRSSSNILETLALGWDSFGLEYTISVVCWLLVILEKPKSCHVSSCLHELFPGSDSMVSGESSACTVSAGTHNKGLPHQLDSPMCQHVEVLAPITCSSQQS